ncbi:MAG: MaoC family dehydratase N-terminal domain-containing protein, partial [Parasporobacterium sp.]|nr:MaoC family dehydratase N-terminal domain-containing protein [Parasporobacterium sp.]
MAAYNKEDFILRYPGVYDEREKAALKEFWDTAEKINKRGPIDVNALISGTLPEDTPGIGPVLKVTENMIRYNHAKYEQENPLFNDAEHAKKAGYIDIPAYFTFGAHDDSYTSAFPEEARDTLMVSQASHRAERYADVYPGDTLYLTTDKREMVDITPAEGSIHRSCGLYNEGTIYNQRGEIVNKVSFHYTESLKTFKPDRKPADFGSRGFADIWEAPDWEKKEDHVYTDEDYAYMKEIWKNEQIQGSTPRYWEDVNIGDRPTVTLDGPIIESALPAAPYGHGIGGTRTMKKELLDEDISRTMV